MNVNERMLLLRVMKLCLVLLPCLGFISEGLCDEETAHCGKPLTYWIKMAGDKDPGLRKTAVKTIGEIGPKAAEAVPALMTALQDPNPDIRCEAARALGNIGPAARAAAHALLDLAQMDNKASTRRAAALALKKMGLAALPSMITALRATNEDVRFLAARTIGNLGPEAGAAVPALVTALGDTHANVRLAAAEALGSIGPAAKEAIPALTKALNDEDEDIRDAASKAISEINGGRP